MYEGQTFEVSGRKFIFKTERDDDTKEPWREHDGHGPVRQARGDWQAQKRPGERVLTSDRWGAWLYDWETAIAQAKKDRWGLSDAEIERVTKLLGRPMTRGMIVEEAVKRDFEFIRGWLNDDWYWCGVIVEHPDSGEDQSLWGIESDADDYITEVAHDLAREINSRIDTVMAAEIAASRPDMVEGFRP